MHKLILFYSFPDLLFPTPFFIMKNISVPLFVRDFISLPENRSMLKNLVISCNRGNNEREKTNGQRE